MAADAAVARRDERIAALAPRREHTLDRRRGEVGAVREHDHGRLDAVVERGETAAERRARPALPVRAVDRALERVRSRDDDDLIDSRQPLEDGGEEEALLRRAEPRRRPGGEDN